MKHSDPVLSLKFIQRQLDKTLTPPVICKEVPYYYWPEVDDYTMTAGIAQTPGGRLWSAWFGGGDDDRAVIMLAKSDDGGKKFSHPQFILDPGYAECGMHISAVVGNLWTAPDGRLFLFFTISLGYYDGRAGSWYSVCSNPDDEEPAWSPAKRIADGASLNKPTVLADGRWLLGVSLWRRDYIRLGAASQSLFPELDPLRMANVYESEDCGETWTRVGGVKNIYPTFDEHMILERKDGSLLMYLRCTSGLTYSESFDCGRSWTAPKILPLPTASARFFLTKLQSGRSLLVCYNDPDCPLNRAHLTAYLSEDDGKNWIGGLDLDERHAVSYPDGFQAMDGRIFIQYDRERQAGEILLAAFREEDVLAGKVVSKDSFLKRPIVQSWSARKAMTHAE